MSQNIPKQNDKVADILYCILLLASALVAFCGFVSHTAIHDFFNEFFPQRFFQINCARHGILPLWNPYQSMGIPAYADPQTGTFYIPAYIFALFGEYTSVCCYIEFIAHIFIAASGFYFLCQRFVTSKPAAFAVALCYSLSGFFVGNAQHLSWIIAGAWLPWILLGSLLLYNKPCLENAILTAVSLSFLITGSYPGFLFTLVYLIASLSIVESVRIIRNHDYAKLQNLLFWGMMTICMAAILSMPTLIAFIDAKHFATRGESLNYSQISDASPFLLTLLFPVSASNPKVLYGDISMRSVYIGTLTLIFSIIGIFRKKNSTLWTLSAFGVFALLMAYGTHLPFHKMAFHTLPFFDHIRIPALMRIYFIIPMLLLAANGLEHCFSKDKALWLNTAMVCLIVADMVVHTLLAAPLTVYDKKMRHSDLSWITTDRDWTAPQKLSSSQEIALENNAGVLWQNAGCFFKVPEWDSYNPFNLRNHDKLCTVYSKSNSSLTFPVVSLPDTVVCSNTETLLDENMILLTAKPLFSVHGDDDDSVFLQSFLPGTIIVSTSCLNDRPLVLAQTFCKGWECFNEDGCILEISEVNYAMMSVTAPFGDHTLTFRYSRPVVKFCFVLEIIAIIITSAFGILLSLRGLKREKNGI